MSLLVPQGCVTTSSASLLWTPLEGASVYRVFCNGRPFKQVRRCSLGVRGLLHDRTYTFEVTALLGSAEIPCGSATLTTQTSLVEYNVSRYGADPTGQADSTAALQQAIDACRPGGLVYLMAGRYRMAGTLRLKDGLCFYMEPRAVLCGPTLVGNGLHGLSLMGGRWESAALRLQGCQLVCLRDLTGDTALELDGCQDVTLDNTPAARLEGCRRVFIL